jgi:hypothetical protein
MKSINIFNAHLNVLYLFMPVLVYDQLLCHWKKGVSASTGLNCGVEKFILQMKYANGLLIANLNGWNTWNLIPNHNLKPPILSTYGLYDC